MVAEADELIPEEGEVEDDDSENPGSKFDSKIPL